MRGIDSKDRPEQPRLAVKTVAWREQMLGMNFDLDCKKVYWLALVPTTFSFNTLTIMRDLYARELIQKIDLSNLAWLSRLLHDASKCLAWTFDLDCKKVNWLALVPTTFSFNTLTIMRDLYARELIQKIDLSNLAWLSRLLHDASKCLAWTLTWIARNELIGTCSYDV